MHTPRIMNVLGFNATHDGACVLVQDGEVTVAVEEERFSRRKHHYGFPEQALRFALESRGLHGKDLDAAAFYWNPYRGLVRFGWHFLATLPRSLAYLRMQPGIFGSFVKMPRRLRRAIDFRGRFVFVDHHLGHAASAFFPSPFDQAAILTVDGTGEWTTTWLGYGNGTRVQAIRTLGYPHSLGKLYEALTQYLGFRINSGEGKVMGLAPYGRARFREEFGRLIRSTDDGLFRLDMRYFRYQFGHPVKYAPALVKLLGPPREPESPIDDRHCDVAATLQEVVEDQMIRLARVLHRLTGMDRLCLAGGVALNCVANGRLLRESPFRSLFVQPAAHDAGAGLGAALWLAAEAGDDVRRPCSHVFLGRAHGVDVIRSALEEAGFTWREPSDLAETVSGLLADGQIVGWFQGRAEFGPRALGNRSILADPRRPDMKDTLNARVKHREPFRPFAPAVLHERAGDYFEGCGGAVESPFMLLACPVVGGKRAELPAITHVDGSARVQTVRADVHPLFHELIAAFGRRTGVPVLLNTSFNRRGEPIVDRPEEAIAVYRESDLDALVLGPCLVVKAPRTPGHVGEAGARSA